MEKADQGRDAAILEIVIEAARPLTHGQVEGLGGPTAQAMAFPFEAGLSYLSMAEAVQPPMLVAI